MRLNEFEEADKARRKERQFLRKNGLIIKFSDPKLTEEQKTAIKEVIPNITPQQDFNFYEIFYTPGDLKIEDKKNNSYEHQLIVSFVIRCKAYIFPVIVRN